jgi:hypothetical protein
MHTAWGVFKAYRMSGIEDRGEFYQAWYMAVDLQPGEVPLKSWKAMVVPATRARQLAVVGGNLILTSHRVLFEPYASQRSAFGVHGTKLITNTMAGLQDRISPRASIAMSRKGLRVEARDEGKHALVLSSPSGPSVDFYFPGGTNPTVFGRGDANTRDQVLTRLQAV